LLARFAVRGKRVLLRPDPNVPVKIGAVTEAACTGANDRGAG